MFLERVAKAILGKREFVWKVDVVHEFVPERVKSDHVDNQVSGQGAQAREGL